MVSRAARCGSVQVWEDRVAQKGRTIDLNLAVVPAWGARVEADPLFVLAGGPGQAATSIAAVAAVLRRVNEHRDIVLVDQRGTGKSNPLTCPATPDTLSQQLADARIEDVQECLEQLNGEPRFYTTDLAMDDLDDVRAALGYEKINLYGASYGSRAALIYMRRHPDRVRRVILDGAAPTDVRLVAHAGRDAQRALDQLFERCATNAACVEAFGDLRATFEELLSTLEATPVTLRHPRTGVVEDAVMTRDAFANMVRTILYLPEATALLPLAIDRAAAGDFAPLLGAVSMFAGEENAIAAGMYLSVVCAEDEPRITAAQRTELVDNFLGPTALRVQQASCALWPAAKMPEAYFEPVTSDAPTLILSGGADPVLPPSWGEVAAKTLSSSRHIVVPGAGHGLVTLPCLSRTLDDFIDGAAPLDVQHTCKEMTSSLVLDASGRTQ